MNILGKILKCNKLASEANTFRALEIQEQINMSARKNKVSFHPHQQKLSISQR